MVTFIYRCPSTGLNVQGWIADDGSANENEAYQALTCLACRQTHLVNPTTRKVLSADDEWAASVGAPAKHAR